MTRVQILLSVLAAILVVVLFWLLLWSPQSDELEALRAETEDIENRQAVTATRISELESVRDEAPEQEALLASARAVVPGDAGLPGFLRQLQLAADDSNLSLVAVAPARPTEVTAEGADQGLHNINMTVELQGSYFQVVDFLRRIEDPAITPRGMVWNALSISGDPEEYPSLSVSLQGDLYAVLPVASEETPPEAEPETDEDETGEDENDEADVDVDVDVEIEDDAQ
jgi:Tfp pilus assembly protein PilO